MFVFLPPAFLPFFSLTNLVQNLTFSDRLAKDGEQVCGNCGTLKPLSAFPFRLKNRQEHLPKEKKERYYAGTCNKCVSDQKAALTDKYIKTREENPPIVEKRCKGCNETLEAKFFDKKDDNPDGLRGKCLKCTFMTNVLKNAQWDTDLRNKVENCNLKSTIPIADLENLCAVRKFCPITGSKLVYCRGMVNMASLDRIDDDIGYEPGNIRFVNIRVNTPAKWTVEKWEYFCTFSDNPANLPSETEEIDGFTLRTKLLKIKNSANHRNHQKITKMIEKGEEPPKLKEITFNDIESLWKLQQGRCNYSNLPMSWGKIKESSWTISIE